MEIKKSEEVAAFVKSSDSSMNSIINHQINKKLMRTIYDSQEDESLQLFPEPEPHFRFQRVPEKKNERTAEDEVVAKSYFFCVSGATSAPPRDRSPL